MPLKENASEIRESWAGLSKRLSPNKHYDAHSTCCYVFWKGTLMLRGIDPLLGPELLSCLRAMGHGDEIAIVDANFPAAREARLLIRLDDASAPRAVRAVLSVLPLGTFVDCAAFRMEVVSAPEEIPEIAQEFQRIIRESDATVAPLGALERFAFYDRVRQAFAVVATGERRLYGNIILKKGILPPDQDV